MFDFVLCNKENCIWCKRFLWNWFIQHRSHIKGKSEWAHMCESSRFGQSFSSLLCFNFLDSFPQLIMQNFLVTRSVVSALPAGKFAVCSPPQVHCFESLNISIGRAFTVTLWYCQRSVNFYSAVTIFHRSREWFGGQHNQVPLIFFGLQGSSIYQWCFPAPPPWSIGFCYHLVTQQNCLYRKPTSLITTAPFLPQRWIP